MSVLSERLSAILEDRGMSIAALARECPIERPTLYQYLTGKRAIRSEEHLNLIGEHLCLTKQEWAQVREAFAIERIGAGLYRQRKKVQAFLQSIPMEGSLNGIESTSEIPLDEPVIYGELAVNQAAYTLLCQAYRREERVYLLLQPDQQDLLQGLYLQAKAPRQAEVIHLICLETSQQARGENLDRAQRILELSAVVAQYRPLYYYGKAAERFGDFTAFPSLVVGEWMALQISADGGLALLHTQPKVVELLRGRLQKLAQECRPLLWCKPDLWTEADWFRWHIRNEYVSGLELPGSLCTSSFWTEELLDRYVVRGLPNRERFVTQFAQACREKRTIMKATRTVLLLQPQNVEEFMKTGVFREYPPQFLAAPLTREDRRYLVEQVLQAAADGWLQLRVLPEQLGLLDRRMEIAVMGHRFFYAELWNERGFQLIIIPEPGIVAAVEDYLESLLSAPHTLDQERTVSLLQHWMEAYL